MMIAIQWSVRWPPLEPCGAVGIDAVAVALARRLLALTDEELAGLQGSAGPGLLVVLGAAKALPWVDGIEYLGRPPDAQLLLMPTHQAPSVPAPLLQSALQSAAGKADLPLALLPATRRWIPLDCAAPLARQALEKWLARAECVQPASHVVDAA